MSIMQDIFGFVAENARLQVTIQSYDMPSPLVYEGVAVGLIKSPVSSPALDFNCLFLLGFGHSGRSTDWTEQLFISDIVDIKVI